MQLSLTLVLLFSLEYVTVFIAVYLISNYLFSPNIKTIISVPENTEWKLFKEVQRLRA